MLPHCAGSSGPFALSNAWADCIPSVTSAIRMKSLMTRLMLVRYMLSPSKFFIPTNKVAESRCLLLRFSADRNDHRHSLLIATVLLAVSVHEIFLLELDRDEDVSSRGDGKDEMGHSHRRRAPKSE